MQPRLILKSLMAVGIIFVAAACSKNEPVYSSTPAIEFKSVVKYTLGADATQNRRDSVVVSVVFKDGDGDLGENVRDTTRLKQVFTNQTWGNYQIRTFQFVNGRFEEILIAANTKLFFELANNQRGPLEGLLGFGQKFLYQSNAKLVPVKFRIRLRDRNLNESNIVETDTIRTPVI